MVSSSWFRRHQKKVYIIMIFSMFVWGISYSVMELIPQKPVGKVYGRKVTQNEFADMLGRWQRLFFSQERGSIVPVIWTQLMLVEEAGRMGIIVTPQEVDEGLQRLAFQLFGTGLDMNKNSLIQFLCGTFRLNQEQLIRTLREALLVEKLESFIRSSIKMSTEEAWQKYAMENEQVKLRVLELRAKNFSESIPVTEDEIRSFYEKYKNEEYHEESMQPGYTLPERVKIECLIARYDDMERQISLTEEEMKDYYENNKDAQFKISKEHDMTSGENEDDAENIATVYKPFDEVKEDIRKILTRQKAIEKTADVMYRLDEELYEALDKAEHLDFKYLAEKYKISYEIPKSRRFGNELLTENDLMELFPGSNQIIQAVFDRERYEPSMPYEFIEGRVIFRVIDKKLPAPAPFEEIRNKVVNDLRLEKGLIKAREIAEKYTGTARPASFDEMVNFIKAEYGQIDISVVETDYINRPVKLFNKESRYIEALKGDRPNVAKKAFELKPGQPGIAVETSEEKACYILELIDKKTADKNTFEKDKENIIRRYLYEKQESLLTEWQNDMRKNMEIYIKFQ
ncbi:MAG: hypothetical protein ACUBOA_06055 [Candidatus Loosdrechtia sp.]|uniref:hypothetical protein n=1 Tax=Candidatus Loosdrechtia sp. TaxID=3101272 RepID=UPI003A67E3FA|nr:MAG: hypothetical protein QY305_09215 [Candidatus Jettenia sp. AMX2]